MKTNGGMLEPITKALQKEVTDFIKEGISDDEIIRLYPNHDLTDILPVWRSMVVQEQKNEQTKPKVIVTIAEPKEKRKEPLIRTYTGDEDELIRDMFAHGEPYEKIAKKFGVSVDDMKRKCKSLGLNPSTKKLTEKEELEKQRKYFGRHLKYIRDKKGYKQIEVEEQLGLSRSTISKYETGQWYPEKLETLFSICKFLDIKKPENLFFSKEVYDAYINSKTENKDNKPEEKPVIEERKEEKNQMNTVSLTPSAETLLDSLPKQKEKAEVSVLRNQIKPENIKKLERIATKCGIGAMDILNGIIEKLDEDKFKAKVTVEVEF